MGIFALSEQPNDTPRSGASERRPNRSPFSSEEKVLAEVVTRLVRGLDPDDVWLFGSRAERRNAPDSDFDLLAVTKVSDGGAALTTMPFTHQLEGLVWDATSFRVVPTSSKRNAMIRRASAGTSFARDRSSMSVQRRMDAFLRSPPAAYEPPMYCLTKTCSRMRRYTYSRLLSGSRALLTHGGVSFGISHNLGQIHGQRRGEPSSRIRAPFPPSIGSTKPSGATKHETGC
jgi:predicted nucleotidyltransferase